MTKVCHFTTVHKETDVRIFLKQCVSLARAGYDVYLLVAGAQDKDVDGVKIRGVEKAQGGRLKRMTATADNMFRKALEVNADIYHFHDPELLRIGKKLRRKGKKVIYDAHEDLPRQILTKDYIPKALQGITSAAVERIENFYASRMTAVIAATPFIRDRYLKVNKNAIDINNFPDLFEAGTIPSWESRQNEVCYVGGLFWQRGITEMVDAMEHTKAKLNLAGSYTPATYRDDLSKRPGWKSVKDWGFVGRKEVKEIMDRSIAGIVTLHPQPSYMDSLPIKMFEYMAAGIPVIASNFPQWKVIIEKARCGICVDPLDPKAIGEAIEHLIANPKEAEEMGKRGRAAAESIYNWKKEEEKLIGFYRKIEAMP